MAAFAKASFGHASYAAFRPSYPSKLYDAVLAYHQGPRKLLLDLGCGTGIATREMSNYFVNAIGTDPSTGMVKQAQQGSQNFSNLTFRLGSAENSAFLGRGEVDCVIAAQAAHWFDYSELWPEMRRLIRPGGTVAFWGYKDYVFVDFPAASKIMMSYAYDQDKLGSFWPQPGRSFVQDKLRVIQPPSEDFSDLLRIEYEPGTNGSHSGQGTLFMEKTVTVGGCKEYHGDVDSWESGWKEVHSGRVARSQGGEGDILDQMFDEIAEHDEHFRNEGNLIDIEWGSALVLARRK